MILTDEFSRQAAMEKDLGIPSALFAAPVRETVELGKSQLSFMNMFAIPLFQGVTDIMPAMEFCVEELHRNKSRWELKIREEQERPRTDSFDSRMMDGMFSPRSMSLATPSDASHQKTNGLLPNLGPETDLRIRLLNKKSPFATQNGTLEEEDQGHDQSMPEHTTESIVTNESAPPSSSEVTPEANSRRSAKPSHLQLSHGTYSASALFDHPSQDQYTVVNGEPHVNGVEIPPSLVTDAVVMPPSQEPRKPHSAPDKQRSSDTTEGSNSATGDWTSQATSATTNKMPLSPSTQGTSITSQESLEMGASDQTPTSTSPIANAESQTPTTRESMEGSHMSMSPELKGIPLMETVRNLKKKPSRFRMNSLNFWKRSKSSSPPKDPSWTPNRNGGPVGGSDDEGYRAGNESSFS
jgi:3',5'-cyclic-nucleotide phosphodiesterase